MPTRVKVCCIRSGDEAALAIEAGARALGLVSAMPSGPGVISEDTIAEIARSVPRGISTFLLTSEVSALRIVEQHRRCGTTTIQLCDYVDVAVYSALRAELPGVSLVQVIHVEDEESVEQAVHIAPFIDALLLDSGNTRLGRKELGGTGRTHDWQLSRRIRDAVKKPLYLAGGLTAANVSKAIAIVDPWGVDLCSGVRTDGHLDRVKLDAFMAAVKRV